MSDNAPPPYCRTSPGRALILARIPDLLRIAQDSWRAWCRRLRAPRFQRPLDWLRLLLLAGILLILAAFAVAEALGPPGVLFSEFSGSEPLFAGVAIVLFIAKIGRQQIYGDWLLCGAVYAGVGVSLLSKGSSSEAWSLVAFCLCLITSGAARIWVGLCADPPAAGAWLVASGGIGMLGSLAAAVAKVWELPLSPLSVAATDLLLLAIAVAGFGLTLRDSK